MQKTLHSERNALVFQMLRDLRTAIGMTQAELAAKLEAHQTDISRAERGVRRLDILELHDWLDALGVPLLDFVAELDSRLHALKLRNKAGRRSARPAITR